MTCYHPLKAFDVGNRTADNKIKYKICSYDTIYCHNFHNGSDVYDYQLIPCGHCIGCRLDYAREWATRCCLEASLYKYNYFVTLTYDDLHVPFNGSLNPDHLTKFMKDLREYFRYHYNFSDIRFFACGEYGTASTRCHFHIILFNCDIPDLEEFSHSNGYIYYRSPIIEKIWTNGFSLIAEMNYKTAAYCARYVIKKRFGTDKKDYKKLGIVPEFVRMSRKPGIGYNYLINNLKIYENDKVFVDSRYTKIPKYFDKYFEKVNPDELARLKLFRKAKSFDLNYWKMKQTDLDMKQMLLDDENKKENKTKILNNRGLDNAGVY